MKDEIRYEGMINPGEKTASFREKIDKQGRIPVPRLIRDKLGMQGKEAQVEVRIKVVEVYE